MAVSLCFYFPVCRLSRNCRLHLMASDKHLRHGLAQPDLTLLIVFLCKSEPHSHSRQIFGKVDTIGYPPPTQAFSETNNIAGVWG